MFSDDITIITFYKSYMCFQNTMLEAYYPMTLSGVDFLFGRVKEH